eukprot:ANDGO_08550.mRNA.1 hypothetical protein
MGSSSLVVVAAVLFLAAGIQLMCLFTNSWCTNSARMADMNAFYYVNVGVYSYDAELRYDSGSAGGPSIEKNNAMYTDATAMETKSRNAGIAALVVGAFVAFLSFAASIASFLFWKKSERASRFALAFVLLSGILYAVQLTIHPMLRGSHDDFLAFIQSRSVLRGRIVNAKIEYGSNFAMLTFSGLFTAGSAIVLILEIHRKTTNSSRKVIPMSTESPEALE